MKLHCKIWLRTLAVLVGGTVWAAADYRETVGWERLREELGQEMPTGAGISVSLIESNAGGVYQPDTGNFDFAGKEFSIQSGGSGVSAHATVVAQRFFGNFLSMSGGIDEIDVYESTDWLLAGFLRTNEVELPEREDRRIQNHSWAGSFTNQELNVEASRRLDYVIERDGFLAVVALRNGKGEVPGLLAHAYNALIVGRPDGNHSAGGTWFEEAGRTRPDLVAPGGFFTSYAAPVVSSTAALLLEKADQSPGYARARRDSRVMRAILMAGASKERFANWSRQDDRPLDDVFGAGEVSVYKSYRILAGGEHRAEGEGSLPASGWSCGNILSGESGEYSFAWDSVVETFTAHLSWNRQFSEGSEGTGFAEVEKFVPRLELRLFRKEAGTEIEIQASLDAVNNQQHIFVEGLAAGDYVLRVERIGEELGPVGFALAWDAGQAEGRLEEHYSGWQARFFLPEERDPGSAGGIEEDPDGDGMANLLEFALGGHPRRPDREILPRTEWVEVEGEVFPALRFNRRSVEDEVRFVVEVSEDLTSWEARSVLVESVPNEGGTVEDVFRDIEPVSGEGRRFLRLRVQVLDEVAEVGPGNL